MLMRWVVRTVASLIGIIALVGVGYAVHKFGMKDPAREMFREGVEASRAVREQLGRDCNLRVEQAPGTDEQVVVVVKYPDPPLEPPARKELIRNTNIVVRRWVHHIKELRVVFEDEPEPIPSWDGGVAVPGAPVPIGVDVPAAIPSGQGQLGATRIGVAPLPVADAGTVAPRTPPKVAAKMGTVTLVTFPDADVFKAKERLGWTPMFNVELAVGTHMLTLVGDDGLKHKLSLPVKIGKNKPLKMNLADLPLR